MHTGRHIRKLRQERILPVSGSVDPPHTSVQAHQPYEYDFNQPTKHRESRKHKTQLESPGWSPGWHIPGPNIPTMEMSAELMTANVLDSPPIEVSFAE